MPQPIDLMTPDTRIQTADPALDLVLLDPAHVRLFRTGGSVVRAEIDDPQLGPPRSVVQVTVGRAFPFTRPDTYIGLRDGRDKDIGMLVTLNGLENASRAIVDEELSRRYFLPRMRRIVNLKKEHGLTTWEVETDKGHINFTVLNIRDSTHYLTATRLLIVDRDGNRYEIVDMNALDARSRALLQGVL